MRIVFNLINVGSSDQILFTKNFISLIVAWMTW